MPKEESFRIPQARYLHWSYQIIHSLLYPPQKITIPNRLHLHNKRWNTIQFVPLPSPILNIFSFLNFFGRSYPVLCSPPPKGVKTIPMLMEHQHPSDAPLSQTIIVSPSLSLDDPVRDGPPVIVWKWITLW
ncbi:hypothetical protein TNCT_501821 [Trichonephila clavata]|uniref:Uncharacterized protein n=1 Tax=Trichonephila clavata TaxID=2740835 RepID=A0A8X6L688_TRICU|nr:hypothetical protein TNCT_501821 [Trichonephila clavata]